MRRIYQTCISLAIVLLIASCSSTKTVTMNTMRPAEIYIPSEISTIVLVDRTRFEKEFQNIAEGVLTGEMPGQDKAALQAALSSLGSTLGYSPRFNVKIASERLYGNSLTSAFPEPLAWSEVSSLCRKYDADALVAFEIFDSDFIVTHGSRDVKKEVKQGDEKREIVVKEFYAEGVADIKLGVRIYNPLDNSIIDQDLFSRTNTWSETADSKAEAIAKLIDRVNAVSQISRTAGSAYAYKIAPMPVRISRMFYSKSKNAPAVAQGARQAQVNDWEAAAKTWQRGLINAETKDAGKLSYNIAIANEVIGDYETALIWAKESFVKYGNKKARSYVAALENRMWDEQVANEQLR